MIKISEPVVVTDAMTRWQQAMHGELSSSFFQVDPHDNSGQGFQGNSGFPKQLSRLVGVDFGVIPQDLTDFIKAAVDSEGDGDHRLSMVLGIGSNQVFQVYFEARTKKVDDNDHCDYYGVQATSINNGMRVYDVTPDPVRPIKERMGVSTDLRNDFVFSWLNIPVSLIPDLFLSKTVPALSSDSLISKIVAGTFPRYSALVRPHRYMIDGNNLKALNKLFQKPKSNYALNLRLGVNTSDLFVGKDLFTLILEVKEQLKPLDGALDVRITSVSQTTGVLNGEYSITFHVDTQIGSLDVKYVETGVEVFNGTSETPHKGRYNELIEIPGFGNAQHSAIIRSLPRFLEIQINDSESMCGDVYRLSIAKIMEHFFKKGDRHNPVMVDPPVQATKETAYLDTTYLEYVGGCPPVC
jgi:hypothetical protein